MSANDEQIKEAAANMPGLDLATYRAKHKDYRGRMADGRRSYLAYEPETGATVLLVEAPECDCGGSGWTPGIPDDERCLIHGSATGDHKEA